MKSGDKEMRRLVEREIVAFGCAVTGYGIDGRGHQKIAFSYAGAAADIRLPASGKINGCARQNILTRARREIRELISTTEHKKPAR